MKTKIKTLMVLLAFVLIITCHETTPVDSCKSVDWKDPTLNVNADPQYYSCKQFYTHPNFNWNQINDFSKVDWNVVPDDKLRSLPPQKISYEVFSNIAKDQGRLAKLSKEQWLGPAGSPDDEFFLKVGSCTDLSKCPGAAQAVEEVYRTKSGNFGSRNPVIFDLTKLAPGATFKDGTLCNPPPACIQVNLQQPSSGANPKINPQFYGGVSIATLPMPPGGFRIAAGKNMQSLSSPTGGGFGIGNIDFSKASDANKFVEIRADGSFEVGSGVRINVGNTVFSGPVSVDSQHVYYEIGKGGSVQTQDFKLVNTGEKTISVLNSLQNTQNADIYYGPAGNTVEIRVNPSTAVQPGVGFSIAKTGDKGIIFYAPKTTVDSSGKARYEGVTPVSVSKPTTYVSNAKVTTDPNAVSTPADGVKKSHKKNPKPSSGKTPQPQKKINAPPPPKGG